MGSYARACGGGGEFEPPRVDLLSAEYDGIQSRTSTDAYYAGRGGFSSALAEENRSKNRYMNILPFEATRVKLTPLENVPGSDYINANFIDREIFQCPFSYIATQAPLSHCTADFWRMILEHQCRVIVMATKEREGMVEKSAAYWESDDYGVLSVECVSQEPLSDSVIRRVIHLKRPGDESSFEVVQFQFLAWPDFGVPSSPLPVLKLMDLAEAEAVKSPDAPIVVHCSAGVGRSGSFLAIHIVLSRIRAALNAGVRVEESPFSQLNTVVNELRSCRLMMVQKKDQYIFCHSAVAEGMKSMDPTVAAQE